jgi:hypothetical protein
MMEVRECGKEECPYCVWSMSIMGKRKSFCSMSRPFLATGCPRNDIRAMDMHMRKFADF